LPHLDAAYRFARWLCRADDADDVVQEAILRAFRGFDALRGSNAKAWLLTIVRNCHFTAAKQQQRRGFEPLPEENDALDGHAMISTTADPESDSILSDQKKVLDRLIASLSEEHRTVLMLREIEEMDYAQIAAVTGVPIGTVMSRLARSRAALKAKWAEVEGEPRAVR
jgi:RNA polymerase sigma factor (sigma-70 family)